ncbi:class I SAM-dependent methyltransferase [Mesorhizobium sp. RCC_202]|uniref:class I SAM-dependent methyltransferase n=1 Tax=Mesorhizobium sp. RCC_202 TaxID=3239222 RepID=UPI003524BA1C
MQFILEKRSDVVRPPVASELTALRALDQKEKQHMAPRFIARQLSHPKGLLGRMMGLLMNRHNAQMNAFAVRQLNVQPGDRILEIGFGGGLTLPRLLEMPLCVTGIDRSQQMVRQASAKFRRSIQNGRADFRVGTVEALPFQAANFSNVITVNTVYFWTSLGAGCSEIHRVLAPGGRAIIGFLPKEYMAPMNMPVDIFTLRAVDEVRTALHHAGFSGTSVERPSLSTKWNVIVATR